jgi:predicted thioesterase
MVVTPKDTSIAHGSGNLEILATPALVALMENTALKCLDGALDEGQETVGTVINVKHVKATPVGKKITCRATISRVDGRRVSFLIEAWDDTAPVGTAEHDRVIIDREKFTRKIEA